MWLKEGKASGADTPWLQAGRKTGRQAPHTFVAAPSPGMGAVHGAVARRKHPGRALAVGLGRLQPRNSATKQLACLQQAGAPVC
jgi:hypothetical protein